MTNRLKLFSLVASAAFAQAPMPDLVVRTDVLARHWVVRDETFAADLCSVQEGDVTPGDHRVLRFTVTTPNVGNADLALGDPNAHVAANDGLYEYATCHKHFHFRHYALYQLIDPATGFAWRAAKRGFCMIDVDPNPGYLGQPAEKWQFRSCGAIGVTGNQGISAGWADTYVFLLGGQYFVLDGGDGQPEVPPGNYILRITVNPGFAPALGEPCRNSDPLRPGICHQLPESDYENNVGQITVTIPDRPGKNGFGPLAGSPPPTAREEIDHN
jgi:Lysyl oxidase